MTAGSALPPHFAYCSVHLYTCHQSGCDCGVSPTTTLCILLPHLCTSTHVTRVGVTVRGQPDHHTLHATSLSVHLYTCRQSGCYCAGSALPPHFARYFLVCAPLHMSPEWVLLCRVSPTTTLCMLLPCLCTAVHGGAEGHFLCS